MKYLFQVHLKYDISFKDRVKSFFKRGRKMKYLFKIHTICETSLKEYTLETLSMKTITQEQAVKNIRSDSKYYENARIHRGLLEIKPDFVMPDIELEINGEYIFTHNRYLFVLRDTGDLIRRKMRHVSRAPNWVLFTSDKRYYETSTEISTSRECLCDGTVASNIKSVQQAKRVVLIK